MMRDPVTVGSGMTFDRESIERWIFAGRNRFCPITRQPLAISGDADITPNHTLRRLIQAWCTINEANGVERIPTPKPPVDQSEIVNLLGQVLNPNHRMDSLQKLKVLAAASDRNRRCIETAGAVVVLASILRNEREEDDGVEQEGAFLEALSLLHGLQLSDEGFRELAGEEDENIPSLVQIMRRGSVESRAYAVFLLRSVLKVLDPIKLAHLRGGFFEEIVRLLQDQIAEQATKAALEILVLACPWGRNRIRAAEGGAVHAMVELLLQAQDRKACEMTMLVLDQLCRCAQGRADFLRHAAGIAAVSKKMIRVSPEASSRAVRILHSVATFSANPGILNEMLQFGAVSKLCMMIQFVDGGKATEKAREILVRHSGVWRNSPCAPAHLMLFPKTLTRKLKQEEGK